MASFQLTSPDFADGDYLGKEYGMSADFGMGCAGGNVSPGLSWTDPPAGTETFAVTCHDPDAPTLSGFWHWIVVNIPGDARALPRGAGSTAPSSMPVGALQTIVDTGKPGYAGPCPPEGDHPHRYFFTVYAVGGSLPVDASTMPAVISFQLHFNTLAKASIVGLFKR
ncbi:MAG: YbhB/YbcL family Raf kinase inhibitor-like protein [Azospirillaceae bacterium]